MLEPVPLYYVRKSLIKRQYLAWKLIFILNSKCTLSMVAFFYHPWAKESVVFLQFFFFLWRDVVYFEK